MFLRPDVPMIEFDSLHFTECTIGFPTVTGLDLMVPVSGVLLVGEASSREPSRPLSGVLIFKRVQRSVRKIIEYRGDPRRPDGYKDPYVVEEAFAPSSEAACEYAFEGVQADPEAWVDWTVWADSFEFVEQPAG